MTPMLPEKSHKRKPSGFSLAEVVIALALIAVAIPTIISMFGTFANVSSETKDRDDIRSLVNEVTLFLQNEAGHASNTPHFDTVFEWVKKASQNPDQAEVLYGYLPISNEHNPKLPQEQFDLLEIPANLVISETPPKDDDISLIDGRITAVEILAAPDHIIPRSEYTTDATNFSKSYLPLEIHIYALASPDEPRSKTNFLDSFPIVLSR